MKALKFLSLFLITGVYVSCGSDDSLNGNVRTSETAHLYATTKTGQVKKYDINTGKVNTFNTLSQEAEGVYFSTNEDTFTIVSRSGGRLETYAGISSFPPGATENIESELYSQAVLESPRDLAVNGNFYVVSDNTDLDGDETTPEGRLFIFMKTEAGFMLRNTVTTKFKVWGVEFVGDDLYAVVDETNRLAVYRNFIATHFLNRIVTADKIVAIQGLLRTHGIHFDNGTMVLSDIGEVESPSDGALHVIKDFENKFTAAPVGGFISSEDQNRISGGNTKLGNPVNIQYDSAYNVIFVAEAKNSNGLILAFNKATSIEGNVAPDLNYTLAGANSVYFHSE